MSTTSPATAPRPPASTGPAQTQGLRGPSPSGTSGLLRQAVAGLRVLLALTVLCGLAYPALVLAVAQLTPGRAGGSMVSSGGRVVGSSLLGQPSRGDRWFQPRPSVAGTGYDPTASGASNLGPSSTDLLKTVRARQQEVARADGVSVAQVPPDAVTASGSGLDPHISPAYAAIQVARVARATGLEQAQVRRLVAENTRGRTLGFIGEPVVDVLELNIAVAEAAKGS